MSLVQDAIHMVVSSENGLFSRGELGSIDSVPKHLAYLIPSHMLAEKFDVVFGFQVCLPFAPATTKAQPGRSRPGPGVVAWVKKSSKGAMLVI
jgi:hypothetical protein